MAFYKERDKNLLQSTPLDLRNLYRCCWDIGQSSLLLIYLLQVTQWLLHVTVTWDFATWPARWPFDMNLSSLLGPSPYGELFTSETHPSTLATLGTPPLMSSPPRTFAHNTTNTAGSGSAIVQGTQQYSVNLSFGRAQQDENNGSLVGLSPPQSTNTAKRSRILDDDDDSRPNLQPYSTPSLNPEVIATVGRQFGLDSDKMSLLHSFHRVSNPILSHIYFDLLIKRF